MNPTREIIEFTDTDEIRAVLAELLIREGAVLEVRPFNEITVGAEYSRRVLEARKLAESIVNRLRFHGIKAIDLEVADAGRRLALTAPQS